MKKLWKKKDNEINMNLKRVFMKKRQYQKELKTQDNCIAKRKEKKGKHPYLQIQGLHGLHVICTAIIEAKIPTNFEEALNSEKEQNLRIGGAV